MLLNSAAIEKDFSLPLGNIGSVQPAILPSYLAIFQLYLGLNSVAAIKEGCERDVGQSTTGQRIRDQDRVA
jgi:hypothetical protein